MKRLLLNHSIHLTAGLAVLTVTNLSAATHYVSKWSVNPTPPYATWATAATNIQAGVNVAAAGDSVLVTNGVYPGGVTVTSRLALLSANGPQVTVIDGGGTNRCVLMANDASLTGFTLTNGYTFGDVGGGVLCVSGYAFLTNCTIAGSSAHASFTYPNTVKGGAAGGVYNCTLYNCTLAGNSAVGVKFGTNEYYQPAFGGGAEACTFYNCTLRDNSADYCGGAQACTLYNCTLTGNSAIRNDGGGAQASTLYNCTLTGNSAANRGGGVHFSTLYNCTLTGNSAASAGGGANLSTLYNCTLTGNSATSDGVGAAACTLYNCIVWFNNAPVGANYDSSCRINYSSTTPLPNSGVGNIDADPLFVDTNGWSNLRLPSNSPCINAGDNAYVVGSTDFDAKPRIVGGTVDMGAYEYQTPTSILSYAWAQQYGLPTDGSADYADFDGTGMENWQKSIAGLNPTNSASILAVMVPVATNNPSGLVVSWQSVDTRMYFLQCSTNLAAQPVFFTIQSNIVGQLGMTSFMDNNAVGQGPFFYRVGVQ